ncbi:MAG: hypothetical protein MK179_21755 [Pirellulaceae bacterium]|nr:hypothetical protein [Pirellulaceae bacterium]MDP7379091.1 hypothetical protein [Pirellulaceae bacterium]
MSLLNLTTRSIARLIRDERGSVAAMSTLFLTVMLGLGVIGGLVVVRDHLVQEFGDFGVALDNLDQSFLYHIEVCDGCVITAEYTDDSATLQDPVDAAPACLVIDSAPGEEDGSAPTPSGSFP